MKKEQKVTIGSLNTGLAGQFSSISENIKQVESWLDGMSTEEYISTLIDRLNAEVNATGGYTYIVEGIGLRTYDVAVSDPAVGTEANAVVEMRGGTIRIANTKDAQGNWEWKTVFTAGHIAGELVTAAQIITGYIGSAGSTFIDLDNNIVQLGDTADNSITVSDAGISFNGIGGSTVGFIDSGNTMAVGYKRVESLTSEQVEDVKDGGTATIYMAGWEEPDFADGDLTMTVRYNIGSWVPYTDAFTFSSYGTKQGTVFDAELVAASGSDPWKIVLSLRTSVQLSSASVIINWWADGAAPRVAFGGDTTGDFGFAVNYLTQANGYASFAAGNRTQVTGGSSAAFGGGTRATGNYQLVMGKWNSPDSSKLFIIGNGTDDNNRSNALTVDGSGNVVAAGDASIGGTLHQLGGTDMGQYLDLHTTDVQNGEFTQDYVVRLRPSNTGGNLGIWLNEVGTTNVVHYLLNNGTGRLLYRTSSDGGTTWSSQKGVRSPWTSLGSFTGSNYLNIDLTNYDELMVVAKFSSKIFAANLPKAALTASFQEWWLSGGKDETTSSPANGAGRVLVNVRTTRVQGVAANNGSSNVLSSTTFTVYAR